MAGNGYVSLEALKGVRRLEDDVEIEGLGKFRVQALTQEELRVIGRATKDADDPSGVDGNLYRQYQVAYGLVNPNIRESEGIDAAVEMVGAMHPMIAGELQTKIIEMTFRSASEAFKDLHQKKGSANSGAAQPSGISS